MKHIGIIYGSDTGATEDVTRVMVDMFEHEVELIEVCDAEVADFSRFDLVILGLSTWYDGDLQSYWEDYYETFKTIDFKGQIVAIFGLGDQHGYGEYFIDGVGILAEVVLENGGTLIGHWPANDYEHTESKALMDEQTFYGLALDEDNEQDLTEDRLKRWIAQLAKEYEVALTAIEA